MTGSYKYNSECLYQIIGDVGEWNIIRLASEMFQVFIGFIPKIITSFPNGNTIIIVLRITIKMCFFFKFLSVFHL